MLIIGMAFSIFGYALAYYGIGMAKQYNDTSGHADVTAIPLGVLLGFRDYRDASANPTDPKNSSRPPFGNPNTYKRPDGNAPATPNAAPTMPNTNKVTPV